MHTAEWSSRRNADRGSHAARLNRRGGNVITYIRFERDSGGAYGILDGDTVRPLRGGLFGPRDETGETLKLTDVKLLHPCEPPKILAVGRNYKSHVGDRQQPARPEIFYKPTTSLLDPGDPIGFPRGAKNVHFEGELVLVIGRRVKDASPEEARERHLRRHLRQRRQRARLAERARQRPAMVARQGRRHVRAAGAGDRHRPRLRQPDARRRASTARWCRSSPPRTSSSTAPPL